MAEKMRVAVLFGGRSSEYEVSLRSASYVLNNLDREKYDVLMIGITKNGKWLIYDGPVSDIADGSWAEKAEQLLKDEPKKYGLSVFSDGKHGLKAMADFVFPVMHGQSAEDGSIQGVIEYLGLPFAGCGVASSAVCFDKAFAKKITEANGIAQTPYVFLTSDEIGEEKLAEINEKLAYPLFVKPSNAGSSIGITKVEAEEELLKALEFAASYDSRIVVEQGVKGRELEVAVMGNKSPKALEVGEILAADTFYSYDAKYNIAESKTLVGASLEPEKRKELFALAQKSFAALGCEGYARVDFFMDESGKFLLNEINTIPGFTSISMFPMLAMASGMTYPEVLDEIIKLGIERHEAKEKLVI